MRKHNKSWLIEQRVDSDSDGDQEEISIIHNRNVTLVVFRVQVWKIHMESFAFLKVKKSAN